MIGLENRLIFLNYRDVQEAYSFLEDSGKEYFDIKNASRHLFQRDSLIFTPPTQDSIVTNFGVEENYCVGNGPGLPCWAIDVYSHNLKFHNFLDNTVFTLKFVSPFYGD